MTSYSSQKWGRKIVQIWQKQMSEDVNPFYKLSIKVLG
jgi:hypothetical protein